MIKLHVYDEECSQLQVHSRDIKHTYYIYEYSSMCIVLHVLIIIYILYILKCGAPDLYLRRIRSILYGKENAGLCCFIYLILFLFRISQFRSNFFIFFILFCPFLYRYFQTIGNFISV